MFRRTPLEDVGAARGHGDLKRSIGLFQLTMFGSAPPSAPASFSS
jgi:hypothetical protein